MLVPAPEIVQCPHCGRDNSGLEVICLCCGRSLLFVIGPPVPILRRFRLSHLMSLVALVAVGLGLFRSEPLLGILLLGWLVPTLLRTISTVETIRADGRPVQWSSWVLGFFESMMLALLGGAIGLCLFIAGFGLGGLFGGPFIGVIVGGVVAVFGVYLCLRKPWSRIG
ncbi:hypothetical protein BH23PLA1_BH23PLA1_22460 [soil metagenome]